MTEPMQPGEAILLMKNGERLRVRESFDDVAAWFRADATVGEFELSPSGGRAVLHPWRFVGVLEGA